MKAGASQGGVATGEKKALVPSCLVSHGARPADIEPSRALQQTQDALSTGERK
jgi:hypothetical protein